MEILLEVNGAVGQRDVASLLEVKGMAFGAGRADQRAVDIVGDPPKSMVSSSRLPRG
jgi:hypothetical protein